MKDPGSPSWNDDMYSQHPTPYKGLAGFTQRWRIKRIGDTISRHSDKDKISVVEVGCERGKCLQHLHERFPSAQLQGCDISESALADATEFLPHDIDLFKYDLTGGGYSGIESPDFIVCTETLEHIPNVEKAMENLASIAGKNTTVIITVPYAKLKLSIKKILRRLRLFNVLFGDIEEGVSEWHVNQFSESEILDIVDKEFQVESYNKILWLHHMVIATPDN